MKILSTKEMRCLDETFIREYGVSQDILMENAALGAYYFLREKKLLSLPYIFFCGPGNNGGDGLALARKIFSFNKNIRVFLTGNPSKYKGASRSNYSSLKNLGAHIESIEDLDFDDLKDMSENHIIIDALLGIGLTSTVRSPIKEIIGLINSTDGYKLSLDIPSGLSSESGLAQGIAVYSDATISFGYTKYGHYIGEARKYIKKLVNCNISIGYEHLHNIKVKLNIPEKLSDRTPVGHKGTFGKALFISGCNTYLGAPFFNCSSYMTSGGGYSHLFSTPRVVDSVAPSSRETVFIEGAQTKSGSLSSDNLEILLDKASSLNVTAIGSGLSLDPSTKVLVRDFTASYKGTLIVDGDGLTAIGENLDILKHRKGVTILTPHLKEFSNLSGRYMEEIVRDRINITANFSREYNCYVILKDASTIVTSPGGDTTINPTGNSGLAVAGSGDTLVGILASALANFKLSPLDACSFASFLHGFAGDLAKVDLGEEGLTPTLLLRYIPLAIKKLREDYEGVVAKYSPQNI